MLHLQCFCIFCISDFVSWKPCFEYVLLKHFFLNIPFLGIYKCCDIILQVFHPFKNIHFIDKTNVWTELLCKIHSRLHIPFVCNTCLIGANSLLILHNFPYLESICSKKEWLLVEKPLLSVKLCATNVGWLQPKFQSISRLYSVANWRGHFTNDLVELFFLIILNSFHMKMLHVNTVTKMTD